MIEKIIITKRFVFKPFSELTNKEKTVIIKCWKNPFCARFNAIKDPTATVEELANMPEPTFSIVEESMVSWYDTNYFRAVFDRSSGELVGVCRFGMCFERQRPDIWAFGLFNVVMNHWGEGLGSKILEDVCVITKQEGIKYLYASANNDNFGSYHAMIKNGFKYAGLDGDKDFEYRKDLTKLEPTKEEIEEEWEKHTRRYVRKFGKKKLERLVKINELTKEMVTRIKAGENEDKLVQEYYQICNDIEAFPESSSGE